MQFLLLQQQKLHKKAEVALTGGRSGWARPGAGPDGGRPAGGWGLDVLEWPCGQASGGPAAAEPPDTPGDQANGHGGAGHRGQPLQDYRSRQAQQVQGLVLVLHRYRLHGLRRGLDGDVGRRRRRCAADAVSGAAMSPAWAVSPESATFAALGGAAEDAEAEEADAPEVTGADALAGGR